jgi:hypothetical protein
MTQAAENTQVNIKGTDTSNVKIPTSIEGALRAD